MMAAYSKAAGHTIDGDGVSDAFARESLSPRGRLLLMNSRASPGHHAGGCLFRRLVAATASHLQLHASGGIRLRALLAAQPVTPGQTLVSLHVFAPHQFGWCSFATPSPSSCRQQQQ